MDYLWLLPEGVEDLLPPQARRLELLQRQIMDLFDTWGYDLVTPPLMEYVESLLTTGPGSDLDLNTFKLMDPLTSQLVGIRADITPQVARIDAHRLRREVPVRLCYLGPVLRTRSGCPGCSRNPLQIGAELYGHAGVESDLEVISLMVETLALAGCTQPHLDIGHVGIYRGLITQATLSDEAEATLFQALQRKSLPDLEIFLDTLDLQGEIKTMLAALAHLHGGTKVLLQAQELLAGANSEVGEAIATLRALAEQLTIRHPQCPLHCDLGELRGYAYHTGVVFAAYRLGHGRALAQGGRYDGIGAAFGHPRPATGFSVDLKDLLPAVSPVEPHHGILAPAQADASLEVAIQELRAGGKRVIRALPGQAWGAAEMGCSHELVWRDGKWTVIQQG